MKLCSIIRETKNIRFFHTNYRQTTIYLVWFGKIKRKVWQYSRRWVEWYVPGIEAGFMAATIGWGFTDGKFMVIQDYPKKKEIEKFKRKYRLI